MSDTVLPPPGELEARAVSGIRVSLGFVGLIALVIGVLILVWPGRTAVVGTALIAVYTIGVGIFYGAVAVFARGRGGWSRVGHGLLALLFVVGGVGVLVNLRATAAFLAVFLAVLLGVLWIAEGIVSLVTIRGASQKVWTVLFAMLSIVAGLVLLSSPLWSAVVLWWLLGISLAVLGVAQIVRAFGVGRPGTA